MPNHQPNIAEDEVDNHDTVTASNAQGGPAQGDLTIGAGGGYGGFNCFALTP